jgi:hypothetical protein
VTFQVSRPVFRPPTRPCVLSKRLRSTMNRKSTSPGSVASSQLQWAQFFITFSSPGCTHATGSRGYISDQYTHFLSIYTALRGSKRMRSAINRTSTSPDSVASPQLQCAQFFIVFSSLRCTHAAGSSGDISGQSTPLLSSYTALRAVKETEKCDESHVDLIRQCGKSPVVMSAVLHRA